MSTYGAGAYSDHSTFGGQGHSCNCIGCCKDCGMCSTHPQHTLENCRKLQGLQGKIKDIFDPAEETRG